MLRECVLYYWLLAQSLETFKKKTNKFKWYKWLKIMTAVVMAADANWDPGKNWNNIIWIKTI